MTVGTYTYGTVTGVQSRVGWVVAGRVFGSGTVPTATEVEVILDQVASEIHSKLAEAGYPVDTAAVVTAGAPRLATWLAMVNEDGAAAEVLQRFATAGDPETGRNPASWYKDKYQDALKQIAGSFLEHLGLARTRPLSDLLVCTSVEDADGNEKQPLFKRDTFSYPGDSNDEQDDE